MVKQRLEQAPGLTSLRQENLNNELYPLQFSDFEILFEAGSVPARKLLHQGRVLLDRWRNKVIEPPVGFDSFLSDKYENLRVNALENSKPNAIDGLLYHALPWLAQALDQGIVAREANEWEKNIKIDMVLTSPADRVMLAICNQANMIQLCNKIKRLHEELKNGRIKGLALFRHKDLPINKTAKKTNEYWGYLKDKNMVIRGGNQELASLEAFRTLISQAATGGLTYEGDVVITDRVHEWFRKNPDKILVDFLGRLIEPVVGGDGDETWKKIQPAVQEAHLVGLGELASKLEMPENEILNCVASRNQRDVGIMKGEPNILFEMIDTQGTT